MEIVYSTIVTLLSGTHTSPSPAHLLANRITLPFCFCLLIAIFDQPCQRGHLPLNPETLTIGNKPVTISGDPSKQQNDNIKTVEEHFNNNNPRSMWQGINNITGFKGNKPATVNIAAYLLDELNIFYACFEADNTAHTESAPSAAAEEVSPLSLSVADVTRSFKVGPDGIPVHMLRTCALQIAGVFTVIFNLSLSLSVVPSCFKKINHCAHT